MIEKIVRLFVLVTLVRRLVADRRAGDWDVGAARRRDEHDRRG